MKTLHDKHSDIYIELHNIAEKALALKQDPFDAIWRYLNSATVPTVRITDETIAGIVYDIESNKVLDNYGAIWKKFEKLKSRVIKPKTKLASPKGEQHG